LKLSIILIAHNMQREIPRTLQSLSPGYQQGVEDLDYEVLVIENGSNEPLNRAEIEAQPHVRYFYLQDPPPSPAHAMNFGAEQARGEVLCFMIDGAHMLTPGVLRFGMAAFRAFDRPVVMTRYFFLGPDEQNESIQHGYDKAREDELLQEINWPEDGYRLFEIGTPLKGYVPKITWLNKMVESNCLFLHRETFAAIGGADERFDIPGGGFLNIDICTATCDLPDTQPVLLIGEGSFHQLHGGTTTNVTAQIRDAQVATYKEQYQALRGRELATGPDNVCYLGHQPTFHSKIHLRNRGAAPAQSINPDIVAAVKAASDAKPD
jgi:Glycosyl transferase family 2